MTKEEEIKARFHELTPLWMYDDGNRLLPCGASEASAEEDFEYLLARNEELQREKEKMQAVVDAARDVVGEAADDLDDNKGKCSISSYQIKDLERAIKRLDAKEQDDGTD